MLQFLITSRCLLGEIYYFAFFGSVMLTIDFKNLAEKLLANYPQAQTLSYFDFQDTTLPAPYKAYIINEIERSIQELTELIDSFPYFKFDPSTGESKKEHLIELLRSNVNLTEAELRQLLVSALKLRFNFLVQPHSTLLFFIFDKSTKKEASEILNLLNYFDDYPHLINGIKQRLINSGKSELNKFEFFGLLREIEIEFFQTIDAEKLASLFEPMLDFFESKLDSPSELPTKAIATFFDDIGLKSFSSFFEQYSAETNSKSIPFDSLKEIFENILKQNKKITENKFSRLQAIGDSRNIINFSQLDPFVFSLPSEIPALDKAKLEPIRTDTEKVSIAKPQEIEEIKELLAQFDAEKAKVAEAVSPELEQIQMQEDVEVEEELSIPSVEEFAIAQESTQELIYQTPEELTQSEMTQEASAKIESEIEMIENVQEETLDESILVPDVEPLPQDALQETQIEEASAEPVGKKTSLLDLITPEQKAKFVEELFYTMEDVFQDLVAKIDSSSNLDEAMKHVSDYFKEFGIFEEAAIAKEFIGFVQQKFQ